MADPAQPDLIAPPPAEDDAGGRMSFFEHLMDLRKRLINSAAAIAIGACIGLLVSKHFIVILVKPMQDALRANHFDDKLYFTSPGGYLTLVINIGLYLGVVLAMPFVLYQVWLFVAPGLYKHERRAVSGFIVSSMFLFLCGIAFGYFVMLPQTLKFLIGFAYDAPVKPLISYNEYFELILIILVGLGVIFELPVLIFILSLFGIVTPKFLLKNFPLRHVDHHRRGRGGHADSGRHYHAGVHGAHGRALFRRRAGFSRCAPAKSSRRIWPAGRRTKLFTSCRRVWLGIAHCRRHRRNFRVQRFQPAQLGVVQFHRRKRSGSRESVRPPKLAEVAPPAEQTGGFDGAKAYEHVAKIVSFGPRPPASASSAPDPGLHPRAAEKRRLRNRSGRLSRLHSQGRQSP